MRRFIVVAAFAAVVAATTGLARGQAPLPEPNFAKTLVPEPCAAESGNSYERAIFASEGWAGPDYVRYPVACQRLHFAFGPLTVKPGQNDVLIEPITIEKPAYDG